MFPRTVEDIMMMWVHPLLQDIGILREIPIGIDYARVPDMLDLGTNCGRECKLQS